jgi:Mn-dependent DtxR family transcriptional regulator
MAYTSVPWTAIEEPEVIKTKRDEIQVKEVSKKVEENLPISVARVIKFLNENKNRYFTNGQIAKELKLSEGTVANITNKLDEIGVIAMPYVLQKKNILSNRVSNSQVYQSLQGNVETRKLREEKGVATLVAEIFEKNINKTYSSLSIAKELGVKRSSVSQAISFLYAINKIKLVDREEKGGLIYQNIKGDKREIVTFLEPDERYVTLESYLKTINVKLTDKIRLSVKEHETGHIRLFRSSKSLIKEYEIKYLQKVIGLGEKKAEKKKGLLERIKVW